MKNWFEGTLTRRLLSLALSMAMVLSLLPAGALAEETESTPPTCTCEVLCAETVNESCPVCGTEGGQCAAAQTPEPLLEEQEPQQQEPQQQESEQKQEPVQEPKTTETCAHGNDPESCEACASEARVASVQALIVALPEDVTAETKEAAQSALSAVDEAKSALTESEQAKLDMTRYTALTQKLAALEAQVNNCAHGNDPESCPLCAVQALIDALPDGDSITADNAEEVIEQMGQIDAAAMLMTDDELTKLDFTKFDAAEARLSELAEEQNPEQTATYADNIPYLVCDSNGQNWKTETCATATVVTSSTSDVTWNTGWYVVQGNVAIGTETLESRVTVNGNVHLILENGCNLTVNGGISVNEGNSLTIYAQSTDETTMGSLTATGNYSQAAIGGTDGNNAGTITINGGKIKAEMVGINAAGIGGGRRGSGGKITINGGIVEATGGSFGAGIGGGQFRSGDSITINGGTVKATGGQYAAGIGGGQSGAGGEIIINGGDVTAIGGESASGIGGGNEGAGGTITITITGGKVNAKGRNDSSGIGGGWRGSGGTITITGGEVTAAGGETGTGIGDGNGGSGGTFSTNGGSAVIFANSISDQSGKNTDTWSGIIFEGNDGKVYGDQTLNESLTIDSGKALTIPTDTTLTIGKDAILTNYGTIDIQGTLLNRGIIDDNGTINGEVTNDPSSGMVMYLDKDGKKASVECTVITEEYLNTNSNTLSSGWYVVKDTVTIGSRIKVSGDVNLILADGCNFTVNGGIGVAGDQSLTIYAQSKGSTMGKLVSQKCNFDAGIGGTKNGACGSVLICGGDITSTGGGNSAGIGGSGNDGHGSVAGTIAICGGTVRTFGGNNAPGIGSSISIKNSSPIQISGGTVYAQGGTNAAGIGGGGSSDGGTVTITGGTVTATGSNAPGIGGGERGYYFNPYNPTPAGNGADVTISNAVVAANGIGGPKDNGTFRVTNSVVVSDYIKDSSDTSGWNGIVFLGTEGKVYGNQTLSADLTIPSDKTLTIPAGTTLTIGENTTLTNYGTITIVDSGNLQNNGSIVNYGTMDEGSISGKPPKIIANYLDANGKQQSVGCDAAITAEYLSTNNDTLSAGWYVVQGEVPISSRIKVSGDVHLILENGCNFTVSGGIQVLSGNSLTIYANDTVDGTMGSLTAQNVAPDNAGIGSYYPNACGTITINGGKITATGGDNGAGIGGGSDSSGGIITINGGKITATGGSYAAGIGGGSHGDGGKITITGGTINANLTKSGGAGIGGGSGGSGGEITISGGDITANGGVYYAGIGGGFNGAGGKITITGGKITATGDRAAGIGGGYQGSGGTITISGGKITATGDRAAGIGGGESGAGGIFSTGTDGRAVIFASSISDQSGKENAWRGIIFEGSDGRVYGNQTPTQSFEIPTDKNLLIPKDIELDGAAVTNNGKVYVDGTLTGTFSGTGSVYCALTLTDCTASGVDVVTYQEKTYAKAGGTVTLTAKISESQAFTGWQSNEVTIEGNSFTMPGNAVTVTANYGTAVASVTVGETVTKYASIQEAFDAANNAAGSTLTLLTDVTADAELWVNGSFTLDLNGKQLDMGFSGISINSGSLTVKGAQEYSEITSDSEFTLVVSERGTLTLESGTIENLRNGSTSFAVRVEAGGTATIEGGEIRGRNCISNSGILEMKGGTLEAYCPDFIGLCIHNDNYNEDSVTITGGTLDRLDRSDMFNTAEGITLQGGSFPNGISFTDDFRVPPVRSLLADGYAFYNLGDDTLVSVGNNETGIQVGVEVRLHDHSFTCEKKDDFEHARICACGYSEAEHHDFQEGGDGFCTVCDAYQPADYEAGSYGIKNAGQLFWFADYVNNSEEHEARSAWGQLQGDITIPTKADGTKRAWTPIGTDDRAYRGVFNGNGHSISGLCFEGEVLYASLFGWVDPEGRIENLTIERVEYGLSVVTSKIAGICGVLDGGQITNCTNAANISSPHSQLSAAGICYENKGRISGCTNAGEILTGDSATAGGICVTNIGSIEKCTNTGTIHGTVAGGICVDNGSHDNRSSSIMNCANRVRINASYFAGGICARNFGTVSYSYHYGILNGGPIVDEMQSDGGSCSNCYYLADWETDGIDGTTAKTAAQFASGEVAYLLCDNPSSNEVIWRQTLAGENKQDYPVLDGPQVYRHNSSCPVYSNSPYESGHAHTPDVDNNRICKDCGTALVATVRIEEEGPDGFHGYVNLQDAFAAANEHTATITLLRDANIGEDETLEISGGNVTFQSAEKFDEAEGPTFYTITLNRHGTAIDVMGGTFNFESGILKFSPSWQQYGIVVNSGGTLNFRGGAITGSTEVDSIKMVSGEVNISGGTVGLVETSRGTLNISGGTVHALWVEHTKTELSGGSFQEIQRVTGGDVVFTLLADGYAYYCDGRWVYATNGEDDRTLSGGIQVLPIPVKITAQPQNTALTYGEDKFLSVTAEGTRVAYQWYAGSEPISEATGSTLSLSGLNAGDHSIYCKLTCNGYVLNSDTVTVTVNKAIVETPTVDSKEYTGENQKADISDTDLYTVTKNDGGTDVGTYSVTLKLKNTANYKWSDSEEAEKTIYFHIAKAENVWDTGSSISSASPQYGDSLTVNKGKAKFGEVGVRYTGNSLANGEYTNYQALPTDAGSYTATFTVEATDNYTGLEKEIDFTISPKSITVAITPNGGTYGGTITPATAVANDLVPGDTVDVTLTYSGTGYNSTTVPTQAGTYAVTASINNSNYNLTGNTQADFKIEKATVPTPATLSGVEYDGKTHSPEIAADALYELPDDFTGKKDADTYQLTLALKNTNNYKWDDKNGATSFTIEKKSLTVTAENKTVTYGDSAPTYTASYEGFVTGETATSLGLAPTFTCSYSAGDSVQTGGYSISVSGLDLQNYEISYTPGTLTVNPKTLEGSDITLTVADENLVYTGSALTPDVSVVWGDKKLTKDTDYTVGYSNNVNAGSTPQVTITGIGNYTDTKSKNFTIQPRDIGSVAISVTGDGNLVYTSSEIKPAVTVTNGSYTITATDYDVSYENNVAAGQNTATVKLTGKNNYTGAASQTFSIEKADSTVGTAPAAQANLTYTGQAQTLVTAGSTDHGTMVYSLEENGTYTSNLPTGTNADSYTVWYKVQGDDNHKDSAPVSVTCSIAQKALTVKAKDHTITYGEASANSGVEYSGFVNGETEAVLGGTLAYTYSYIPYSDVGSYTITPGGLTSDNYDITFVAGDLIVQQKEIGIAWGNTAFTYSGLAQKPAAYPRGLVNGDSITLTVIGEQTNAGSGYTATVTAIVGYMDAGNYKLPSSDLTTTFSIAKKEVTITGTAVEATKVYDGTTTARISNYGSLSDNYDGEGLTIVPGTAAYDNKNVGKSKTVTFSGFSLGGSAKDNYTLVSQPASVTASITKKPVTLAITVGENFFDGTNGVNYSTSLEEGQSFVENDDVAIESGNATFAYCYPAENIPVTFTAFSLTGADAGNYSITNPTPENVTGSIKVSNRYLNLGNDGDFASQTEVWVDGVAYPIQTDGNRRYAALPSTGDLLTIYTYKQGTSTAAHENYPTGMAVYGIVRDDGGAKLQKIDKLNNLLQYSGCSIRIKGKPGIRMITSLTKEAKELLKRGELEGYTLEEYGTVVAWDVGADMQLPLTLGNGNKHNYAYKKGVSDPVFANVGNLTQYTNVLVWDSLTDAQLAQDILMRPYIILNKDGETVTLYGGTVSRSIGYVAQQNADTFPKGSAGYNYVHDIIDRVEKYKQNSGSTTTPGG